MERYKRNGLKDSFIIVFLSGMGLPIAAFLIYLGLNNAFSNFYYYSVKFAATVKAHREQFILKSIIGIPVLMFLLIRLPIGYASKHATAIVISLLLLLGLFIEIAGITYFEPSRIYYGIFILLPVIVLAYLKGNKKEYKRTRYMAVFLLFYFLANASSGREIGIANVVSPLFIPVAVEFGIYLNKKTKRFSRSVLYALILLFVLFHATYLSWRALDPNGTVGGVYKKSELVSNLNLSSAAYLKVSLADAEELEYLVQYIHKKYPDKKLLCFPYCPLMNILTKNESPSYFSFFYTEAILSSNQSRVIKDLKTSNSIILVQKKGNLEPEALFENNRLGTLLRFIKTHYRKDTETANFVIYR